MRAQFFERQLALAAVALLATLIGLALSRDGDGARPGPAVQPPAAGETWSEAPAGPVADERYGSTTTCGQELTRDVAGIVHPVLPCGARIVVAVGEREVETSVVDQGPVGPGEEFSLTEPLAVELGVQGIQTVRWRFSTGAP